MDFYDKAIKAYRQAISMRPQFASFHYNLACAYAKKGDIKNARRALDKAISLNPDYEKRAFHDSDLEILKTIPRGQK
jgi:tetratricopeptide (TPR) repeat protein